MNKKIFPFRYKVAAGRLGVRDVHEAPVPQQRGDAQRPARLHRPRHKLQLRRGHHQQGTHQGTHHQQGTHQGNITTKVSQRKFKIPILFLSYTK